MLLINKDILGPSFAFLFYCVAVSVISIPSFRTPFIELLQNFIASVLVDFSTKNPWRARMRILFE